MADNDDRITLGRTSVCTNCGEPYITGRSHRCTVRVERPSGK